MDRRTAAHKGRLFWPGCVPNVPLMARDRHLTFYLHHNLRKKAERGEQNFINRIQAALSPLDFSFEFRPDTQAELLASVVRGEYAAILMDTPPHADAVSLRKTYVFPFWSIEATQKRWDFSTAKATFDPKAVNQEDAARFCTTWKAKVFDPKPAKNGHIYVPLQGRIGTRRSSQFCSPLQMVKHAIAHRKGRDVVIGLHPNETYTEKDLSRLRALSDPQEGVAIELGGMEAWLPGADDVVTQNSAAAFLGFFHHKPAILFGQIDFHHIGLNVAKMGVEAAFDAVETVAPDYEAYLYWFLQMRAINAGRADAEAKILARLRACGWEI